MLWLTSDWVEALAVVIGAIAAWRGFGAWRHELVGRRRYELAEETLTLFYEARQVITDMRIGIVSKDELSRTGETVEAENPVAKAFDAMDAERRAVFARLEALKFRFMATFGPEYSKTFLEFATVPGLVRHAAKKLREFDPNPLSEQDQKTLKAWDEVRYYTGEGDKIEKRLADSIAPIEQLCRELVKPNSLWDRWREWTKPPNGEDRE